VERRKTSIPDRNQKHRSVPDIVFTVWSTKTASDQRCCQHAARLSTTNSTQQNRFMKLIVAQLVNNIILRFGTTRFISVSTRARHRFLWWARAGHFNLPPSFLKIHINTLLPPTPRFSKRALPFRIYNQNCVCTSSPTCVLHTLPTLPSLVWLSQ
jgi:hypothetical protein